VKRRITKGYFFSEASYRGQRILAEALLGIVSAMALRAQAFTTLASFNGTNGDSPQSSGSALVQGTDGNFYGVTPLGPQGNVFKITPGGTLTSLYEFCQANCNDGAAPSGGLIKGTDGNLYGTTSTLGANGYGTVFKITLSGTLTMLYSFGGGADGSHPNGLVQGTDGNFYGTTQLKGANSYGTVFKLTPSGALTTLHSFGAATDPSTGRLLDGGTPVGSLVQANDGNFYGTTTASATVFRITPGGILTTIYSGFGTYNSDGTYNGDTPSELIQGTDGNLYGTTPTGGTSQLSGGMVFKITTSGVFSILYSFCSQPFSCPDGNASRSALVQATDGNFYGTTTQGGANNLGTVFKVAPGGIFTSLHTFSGPPDGSRPWGALYQGTDGNIYGTTVDGGASVTSLGTVFRLQLSGTAPYTCTNTTPPVITSIDSASAYGGYSYFASGSWLEIKGVNLADPADPRLTAATNPGQWTSSDFNGSSAPTSLDGISVSINEKPAYVWYLSTGQLNVQAPEDSATGNVAITVTNCKATSPMFTFARRPLAPGFLAPTNYTANGTQYMVATFQSDGAYVLNTATGAQFGLNSRPAKPGDGIIAYGVGFGDVTPAILPGVIVGQSNSLVNPVTISFGTTQATLAYSGLAGSFVGLYEFYITVPSTLANGDYQINVTQNGTTVPQTMYLTVHN
jgi:uncharacterized protein (TIGR03437 family)